MQEPEAGPVMPRNITCPSTPKKVTCSATKTKTFSILGADFTIADAIFLTLRSLSTTINGLNTRETCQRLGNNIHRAVLKTIMTIKAILSLMEVTDKASFLKRYNSTMSIKKIKMHTRSKHSIRVCMLLFVAPEVTVEVSSQIARAILRSAVAR